MTKLKFDQDTIGLQADLRQRVNAYFKEKGISQHANAEMVIKTLVLISLYFVPYFLILLAELPLSVMWVLAVVMGVAVAGIGMCVMHDANHGSYSSSPWLNAFVGYSLNLIGGNKFNWQIQHNVKHHTFTNIYGADEDLSNGDVIRLSPYSEMKWFHKHQHIYSWFLYMLGTLSWVTIKDFKQFGDLYEERKHINKNTFSQEVLILVLSKVFYYIYMLVIPSLILPIAFWQIFLGFVTIHLVAGLILSVTFQLAHVVETTDHTCCDSDSNLDSWVAHQIKTTSNFARKNRFLNWYLGGLNFQIEHHLFPHICHVHYRPISKIVKQVVEDRGLIYNEHLSLSTAVKSHYATLRHYGQFKAEASLAS